MSTSIDPGVRIGHAPRAELADALRRLIAAGVPLQGASDHGVSEALYLADPDGNGLELYWTDLAKRGPSTRLAICK